MVSGCSVNVCPRRSDPPHARAAYGAPGKGGGLSLVPFYFLAGSCRMALWYLGWNLVAGPCQSYGRGISSCLQMARTVPSLISRWRGTLAILCNEGLNQML
jgi:hypothetical protein